MKRSRLGHLSAVAALCAATLVSAPALLSDEEADLLDSPDVRWRRGPVQYILTRDEEKAFRKLGSDEERRDFITEFWERRDPTPGTEANEFKEIFATRLKRVQEIFGPPAGRGWEEDRGRLVLLLGPPDRVQMTSGGTGAAIPSTPGAPGGPSGPGGTSEATGLAPRPRATFVYESEAFPAGPTPGEFEMIAEGSGGFRLLTRVDLSDPRLTGLEPLPVRAAAGAGTAMDGAAAPAPEPLPAEAAPEPPPTAGQELLDEVLSGEAEGESFDLAMRLDFYKTQETETFTTLTVAVRSPGAAPIVAARLLDDRSEVVASMDGENSFVTAGSEGGSTGDETLFQAARNLTPGRYLVVTAVKDPGSGNLGVRRDEVEVPDFTASSLQMSTVTIARRVEQRTSAAAPEERFVLGNYTVIPAPTPVFRPGQELILYYQVYNTSDDAASGAPKIKVTYKFAKVEASRKIPFRPIVQEVDKAIQIYGITIVDQWPEGDYQVEVQVEDLVAGAATSSVVPFKVEKEG